MPYSNPDDRRAYQRAWMAARRNEWIEEHGGRCSRCGGTDRLEVDHVDPANKSMNPTAVWSLKKEKRRQELDKCQILCHSCHAEKTFAPKPIVHGTGRGYQQLKCRCGECRRWNRETSRRIRAKNHARQNPTRS